MPAEKCAYEDGFQALSWSIRAVTLIIIDEVDQLKASSVEQMRDAFNLSDVPIVLVCAVSKNGYPSAPAIFVHQFCSWILAAGSRRTDCSVAGRPLCAGPGAVPELYHCCRGGECGPADNIGQFSGRDLAAQSGGRVWAVTGMGIITQAVMETVR
jgi:hypothetical protein